MQKKINNLRQTLLTSLTHLEASIDFPEEEEITALQKSRHSKNIEEVSQQVKALINSYNSGKVSKDGLSVTLVGPPNAGKSTLLNILLEEERAIVSSVPGTTRDYIQEKIILNGRLLNLVDTAGIREKPDALEAIGIERSLEQIRKADIILLLFPSQGISLDFSVIYNDLKKLCTKQQKIVSILTKSDLEKNDIIQSTSFDLELSCKSCQGIENLKNLLIEEVDQHLNKIKKVDSFICLARHLHCLQDSMKSLEKFKKGLVDNLDEELLAFELQQACKDLQNIVCNKAIKQ